jgi:L-alanine-DL-glutamate epimerase-like enolase superfamily enzyme
MKITRVTPIVLANRFVLVRVESDEGVTGYGEASPMSAPLIVAALKHSLGPLAVGQDPLRIEALHERLAVGTYKLEGRLQMCALSGLEQACWDLKGKALGVPVHQLLGGAYRDRVRMYLTIARDTPLNQARIAARAVETGFTALKLQISTRQGFDARPDTTLACVREVRTAVGEEIDLLLDANSAWSVPNAIRMCQALEPYHILHLEQPVPERDLDALAQVNQHTAIPITFGEEDYSLWRYKEAIVRGACEVVQPDPIKAGGLLTCLKIAHLAEAFSKAFTPHDTSVNLGMASTLQLVAAVPGARGPQESTLYPEGVRRPPTRERTAYEAEADGIVPRRILAEPFRIDADGCLAVPQGPGLGVTLDEDVLARFGVEA